MYDRDPEDHNGAFMHWAVMLTHPPFMPKVKARSFFLIAGRSHTRVMANFNEHTFSLQFD